MSSESLQKTVSGVIFSFLDIINYDGGRGLWTLISCDDVITGSDPNQKSLIDFGVLGPTELSSEVCFQLVSRTSLRLATIDALIRTPTKVLHTICKYPAWKIEQIEISRIQWYYSSTAGNVCKISFYFPTIRHYWN